MKTRIIAGLIGAILLIWLVFAGPTWLMTLVILCCSTVAYLEYDKLFFPTGDPVRQSRMVALVAFTILAMRDPSVGWIIFWFCFVFLGAYRVLTANRDGDTAGAVKQLTLELLGYLYVVCLFGFMMPIVESNERGRAYLFLLFCLSFGTDTGAYFAGLKFGKHKLAPLISPKKSIEGAVGGLVMATLMTWGWLYGFAGEEMSSSFGWRMLLFAPVGSILAQLGDLFESLLKRSQAQKDSGSFLPGHGGLLDRVDGLLFVSPIFFFYLVHLLERL